MIRTTEYIERDSDGKWSAVLKVEGFATAEEADLMAGLVHATLTESFKKEGIQPVDNTPIKLVPQKPTEGK